MVSVKQVRKHWTRFSVWRCEETLVNLSWWEASTLFAVKFMPTISVIRAFRMTLFFFFLFFFHFMSYIIWELCPRNVKSVSTNLSMQENKNWKACITCICFSHLQTRRRAVTRATKFNNKASRVSVSVPFKLRGYCVQSLQRGACCWEDPWEQEHLHSAGPRCSSLWRVPALALPHHMLSIWPKMSVVSESQLARENNDSSVEAFSLLFL